MKKIIQLAIFLGVICVIASGALFYANSITAPIIAANTKSNTDKLLKELIEADEFVAKEIKEGSLKTVYTAKVKGKAVASVYEVNVFGFQSEIKALFGIDTNGKFIGLKIIEQAETPGYGTQITTNKKYLKQFTTNGVDDEIDTITGSTVTTAALKGALDEAVAHFKANK